MSSSVQALAASSLKRVGPAFVRFFDRERRGERLQRPRTDKWTACAGRLLAVVLLREPGDILAEAILASSGQPDERRHAHEITCYGSLEPLEAVALDLDRQLDDARVSPWDAAHVIDLT